MSKRGESIDFKIDRGRVKIANHLGNVVATTSDRKKANQSLVNTQLVTHYSPQIQNAQDYFPFGMTMPGRSVQDLNNEYRYGFQNQETDKELWEGAVSYKYRIEDPRLGRFFSVDPLAPKYPHNSTYAFSENRVTNSVELEGLEAIDLIEMKSEASLEYEIDMTRTSLNENNMKVNEYLTLLEELGVYRAYRIAYEIVKYEAGQLAEAEGEVIEIIVEQSLDYAESEAKLNDLNTDMEYVEEDARIYTNWVNLYLGLAEKDANCLNEMFKQRIYCQLFDKGVFTLIQKNAVSDKILVAQNMSSSRSNLISQGFSYLGFGDDWGKLNPEQQWMALKVFIDTGVQNCAEFYFEGGCDAYKNSSTSKAVIDYLVNQNGYIWNGDKLEKPQ